jgi:hypothetical protein
VCCPGPTMQLRTLQLHRIICFRYRGLQPDLPAYPPLRSPQRPMTGTRQSPETPAAHRTGVFTTTGKAEQGIHGAKSIIVGASP